MDNARKQKGSKEKADEMTQFGVVEDMKKLPEKRITSKEKTEIKEFSSKRRKISKKRKNHRKNHNVNETRSPGDIITPPRRKKNHRDCEPTQDETLRRKKAHRKENLEKTAINPTTENVFAQAYYDDEDKKIEKGKLMIAEMHGRHSKRNASLKKKTKKSKKPRTPKTIATVTEMSQMKSAMQQPTQMLLIAQEKTQMLPVTQEPTHMLPVGNVPDSPKEENKLAKPLVQEKLPTYPATNGIRPEETKQERSEVIVSLRVKPSMPAPAPTIGTEPSKEEKSVKTSIRLRPQKPAPVTKADIQKDEKSFKQTSIKERLKRGLKSAFSAFSRASLEKSFQTAKAKLGAPKRKPTYDYQDTYMGRVTEDEEDEEDEDVIFYKDMRHRPDLILVETNNTNNGRLFNEKGLPFWKDKKFLAEVPKPTRQPLSTLLLLLAEKKLSLKDTVAAPAPLDGYELEFEEMKSRDKKHFNDELLLSNTIRSIISTLDNLDEYSKNQQVDIQQLTVLEPKTAREYSRHYPNENEEVAFVYSGLGVCRSKKSKSRTSSLTTSSSSSLEKSNRSRRKKKKKDQDKGEAKSERHQNQEKKVVWSGITDISEIMTADASRQQAGTKVAV